MRHWPVASQPELFAHDLPEGLQYRPEFITADEEQRLLEGIAGVTFAAFEMRGAIARRRVAFFGRGYDRMPAPDPEIPAFLLPLRNRIGAWLSLDPAAFAMALINEYAPGAPIGWHRDAPQYAVIAGVSLCSPCRMKFRPYVSPSAAATAPPRRSATHELLLDPRSAYVMRGPARSNFEHHIPAVAALRYSITFRTLRASHHRDA